MDELKDPAETCQHLLSSISRIREERNALRRNLEFTRMEHKFAMESLQKKLAAALIIQPPSSPLPPQIVDRLDRTQRAALVSALVVQHMHSRCDAYQNEIDGLERLLEEARSNLETLEQVSAERADVIMELETDAEVMQEKLGSAEGRLVDADAQIQALNARIVALEEERDRERAAHEEAGTSLVHTEAQLTEVTKSLDNAESTRDSLALRVTHLEQDLETAQNEVEETEARYRQLQSQQLSSMSTSQATRALRSQIEELEGRVLRRTEQIGVHQHDIKRLETNLRLQEERVAEMSGDMEVLMNEKAALLEDCRTTREERDEAMKKCEAMEEAMEVLEEKSLAIERQRAIEVQQLVGVIFRGVASRRTACHSFSLSLARHAHAESLLDAQLHQAAQREEETLVQLRQLSSDRDHSLQLLEEKDALLRSAEEEMKSAVEQARRTSSILSTTESLLQDRTSTIEASKHEHESLQAQVEQLRDHLRDKAGELSALQSRYEALQSKGAQTHASDRAHFTQQIDELEKQCGGLEKAKSELESAYEQVIEELAQAKEELKVHTSDSVERALAEQDLRAELEDLRAKYDEETRSLQDEISLTRVEIEGIRRQHTDLQASHIQELERVSQSKSVVEGRLAEVEVKLHSYDALERELQELQARYSAETEDLRERLKRATCDLDNATVNRDELVTRHTAAFGAVQEQLDEALRSLQAKATLEVEFADMKAQHVDQVRSLETRLEAADEQLQAVRKSRDALEAKCTQLEEDHTNSSGDLESRLARASAELSELQSQLRAKADTHARAEKEFIAELKAATDRNEQVELLDAQLRVEVEAIRARLQEENASVQILQEEKQNLQQEMTALEAEVQRSLSLQRYQESRLNEGERELSTLKEQLERARNDYVQAEKAGKTAEISLSLQTVQHEKLVSSLRKELDSLRESSKLQGTVTELQEKNTEMEDLLRAKCLEIEDNDDRFIELLKEKKKLTSKIDSLTRKVNNLQSKLAATTNPSPDLPPSQAGTSNHPPPPPTFSRTAAAPSMAPFAAPGPSIHMRPKTPEARLPPPPVFKARTPESKRVSHKPTQDQATASQPVTSAGKKRRAPDDFEDCEGIPPQGFTADSAPSNESEKTPRLRRAFFAARTGFTPSRGGVFSHASEAPSSPSRRATTGAPPVIADVTNSPKSKKGWLGKMRGGTSHAPPPRSVSNRPAVFERAHNGYSRS